MTANNSQFNHNRATIRRGLRLAIAALLPLFWTISAAAQCLEVGSGETVDITEDQTVECVTIAASGCLKIKSSITLTLEGGAGHNESTVDGTIVLEGASSTLKITQNDHTLSGQGKLAGQDDDARLKITGNLVLTSTITIEGALQILAGSGTFINSSGGVVTANRFSGDQVLKIASGTIDDASGGEWKVSSSGATLWFAVAPNSMEGKFTVSAGTLDIDENVTTTGNLVQTGGTIDVAPNKTFTAG